MDIFHFALLNNEFKQTKIRPFGFSEKCKSLVSTRRKISRALTTEISAAVSGFNISEPHSAQKLIAALCKLFKKINCRVSITISVRIFLVTV